MKYIRTEDGRIVMTNWEWEDFVLKRENARELNIKGEETKMTPLQAFQKMRELCEEYHLKFTNVKPQTVEGYPIDNIEKALKALEIIKEKRVDACNCLMILNGRTDDLSFEDYSKLFLTNLIKEEYDLLKEVLL